MAQPLSQANALGQGFNVFGTCDSGSLLAPLFDFANVATRPFTYLGREFSVPACVVAIEETRSYSLGGAYQERDELQDALAANAEIEGSAKGTPGTFSGEFSAAYDDKSTRSAEYDFGFCTTFNQYAVLQLNPDLSLLARAFTDAVAQLPASLTDASYAAFARFFDRFGGFYTRQVSLGSKCSFYVAVSKQDVDDTTTIEGNIKANYEGLFASGGVDATVENSQTWKNYVKNRTVKILAEGGDTALAQAVQAANPDAPTPATVNTYSQWTETAKQDPAVIDFKLAGIWELCGDKSETVRQAWSQYSQQSHPLLTVETSVQYKLKPVVPGGPLPTITLGATIAPATPPDAPNPLGFQVVILDLTQISGPGAVVFNEYYTVDYDVAGSVPKDYQELYDTLADDIQNSGFADPKHVLVLASIGGLYGTNGPSAKLYALLRSAGAGDRLQAWMNARGNQVLNYIFVGILNGGPDRGLEALQISDVFPTVEGRCSLNVQFLSLGAGEPATFTLVGESSPPLDCGD